MGRTEIGNHIDGNENIDELNRIIVRSGYTGTAIVRIVVLDGYQTGF